MNDEPWLSAAEIAARFGIPASTARRRARREAWPTELRRPPTGRATRVYEVSRLVGMAPVTSGSGGHAAPPSPGGPTTPAVPPPTGTTTPAVPPPTGTTTPAVSWVVEAPLASAPPVGPGAAVAAGATVAAPATERLTRAADSTPVPNPQPSARLPLTGPW